VPFAADPAPASRLASAREPRDFAARARELMTTQIPRVAQRAERLVMRVLFAAAHEDDGSGAQAVRDAASAVRIAPGDPLASIEVSGAEARRLNEAGRAAYWNRQNVEQALAYQTEAFGANPTDPEIIGNLAFLHLKTRPAQPEAARQLALHALAMHDGRYPTGRIEDWTTLAIASALAGRERDARDAWLATLALTSNTERQCRAALNAYAIYGERLRAPVEAMLYKVQTSGRERSALCEWPPHWVAESRVR
jgi:tetratricopeptide (TPR) repeat protein